MFMGNICNCNFSLSSHAHEQAVVCQVAQSKTALMQSQQALASLVPTVLNGSEILRVLHALQYLICLELVSEGNIDMGSMITPHLSSSAEKIAADSNGRQMRGPPRL